MAESTVLATAAAKRRQRAASSRAWLAGGEKVELNYSKLRELCLRHKLEPQGGGARDDTGRSFHEQFMAEYRSVFRHAPHRRSSSSSATVQQHCCPGAVASSPLHDVSPYLVAVHGRKQEEQAAIDLTARLKAMLRIVKKLPIERSSADVRELSLHLRHFPGLQLDHAPPPVLVGVAARAVAEKSTSKQGYSLPDHGGVYLLLQGSVERLDQDTASKGITSTTLSVGECFGDLKDNHGPFQNSYPMFTTREACVLLRVTALDHARVLQQCRAARASQRLQLVASCPQLQSVCPAILSRIAATVTWETVQANTMLQCEGDSIEKVGFIQSGQCEAFARVPSNRRQAKVCVGVLAAGDCIGELLLRGYDRQPYSVVTTTKATIGWVSAAVIRVNEVEKHLQSEQPLAIETPLQEELRHKYTDRVVQKQWGRIKRDIVKEVVVERGIRLGQSKWRHSMH